MKKFPVDEEIKFVMAYYSYFPREKFFFFGPGILFNPAFDKSF